MGEKWTGTTTGAFKKVQVALGQGWDRVVERAGLAALAHLREELKRWDYVSACASEIMPIAIAPNKRAQDNVLTVLANLAQRPKRLPTLDEFAEECTDLVIVGGAACIRFDPKAYADLCAKLGADAGEDRGACTADDRPSSTAPYTGLKLRDMSLDELHTRACGVGTEPRALEELCRRAQPMTREEFNGFRERFAGDRERVWTRLAAAFPERFAEGDGE